MSFKGANKNLWYYQPGVNIPALVKLFHDSGGECLRQDMILSEWAYWGPAAVIPLKQELDKVGCKMILCTNGQTTWGNSPAECQAIIANPTAWIEAWAAIIRVLQPWGIDVLNEPTFSWEATPQEMAAYRAFLVAAITRWRQEKPDLVCIVMGPQYRNSHWPLQQIVDVGDLPDVYYAVHFYYAYDGVNFQWWASTQAYHDGLADAKTKLENDVFNLHGINYAISKGCKVFWEEAGSHDTNPNKIQFMDDAFALANAKGIGISWRGFDPYPDEKGGLLNTDWQTLNAMGLNWAKNMPSASPGIVYTLVIWTHLGGTTDPPAGTSSIDDGVEVSITATPAAGYTFGGWQVYIGAGDLTTYPPTVNPLVLTMHAQVVVMPLFNAIPPPVCPSGYHWDDTLKVCVQDAAPPSGCFIATACYGSPTHIRVNQLRKAKNDLTAHSSVARLGYHLYYVFSPSVARKIVNMQRTKKAIRSTIEYLWSLSHVKKAP